jgi:aminotransferase
MPHHFTARRTHGFTESVIRGMTRLATEHGAINLAQGFPNFAPPEVVTEAAVRAIRDGVNQYAVTWGSARLRAAVAASWAAWYGQEVDPDREVTITCGATEAMAAVFLACLNPDDEVLIFEPFYENFGPDAILCGATPVFVPFPVDGVLDLDRVQAALTPKTRAIVLNTPNNPTGRVLTRDELSGIATLCIGNDLLAITDEIYEHIVFDGEHVPMATLPSMRERTITVSGASKTFSVTGWRVGTIMAPVAITDAIRKVHDFLTVGAPAPLQEGVAVGLETLGPDFYQDLADGYRARRDLLIGGLQRAGFRCTPPQGAYYVLADFRGLSRESDVSFARRLTGECGVAPVPGSSFYHAPDLGRHVVRFAFCKTHDMLEAAITRLADLPTLLGRSREPEVPC